MYPKLFSIGPLTIYSYGVMAAIAVSFAVWYFGRNARYVNMSYDEVVDFSIITIIFGFVGARLLFVVYMWDYYKVRPLEIFAIWQGGIIFYGGLIGGVLTLVVQARLKKISILRMMDLLVPGVALAQGFGRVGCYLNGCCYGKPTDLPIGVLFPGHSLPLHPAQIYDSIFCFILFWFLSAYYKKHSDRIGATSFLYFTIQPIGRFIIEFFRDDMAKILFGMTLGQVVSAGIFLAATSVYLFRRSKLKS